MGERELIAAIEAALGSARERVVRGIGDDAAVVEPAGVAVTSIDLVVEGVHFELRSHSHADVGHKALASALSDLAAMGAAAGEAYLALGIPPGTEHEGALELVGAARELAERTGAQLVGGDVVGAPVLVVCVTVTGWAAEAGALVYRDGAAAGELVGVTGDLGGSGAGMLLADGIAVELSAKERDLLVRRHLRPEPRLALGQALAAAGASAMIDVSDGIATDARHLAERSGVGIEVELANLPLAPGVAAVATAAGRDPAVLAATAGEDYELLFAASPARRLTIERAVDTVGSRVSWIGRVSAGAGMRLLDADRRSVDLAGYEHLRG